jgi:WD40 repeat protein
MSASAKRKPGPPELRKAWSHSVDGHVIDLAWAPDGSMLAAASADGPVRLFDGLAGGVLAEWPGHAGGQAAELDAGAAWAERVAFSPAADVLATAAGRKLRLWSCDWTLIRECPPHTSTITDLAWRPGGAELASSAYGGVWFWSPDPAAPAPLRKYDWKGSVLRLAWAPNGYAIAAGNQDSSVHFWFTDTGKDLEMTGYPGKVRELAWDPTGRFLATGGSPVVTIWDCGGKGPAGSKPIQFEGHDETLTALAYRHAGPMLAAGSQDGWVSFWPGGAPKRAAIKADLESPVTGIAWSPDDRFLAAGCDSGLIAVLAPV